MDLELQEKVAFIAGSSRGIGKAIAHAFLREGARVVITGRNAEALCRCDEDLGNEFSPERILPIPGDMTDRATIRTALAQVCEKWGRIDCLVANIGSGRGTPGWQVEESSWQEGFETNFHAAVRVVTETLRKMTLAKRGSIVIISSIVGVESTPAPLAYSCAKAALHALTKNLSRQVAADGIRVNAIAPGNVLFEGGSWEKHLEARRDSVLQYIATEVPMKRFGTPGEIADLAVFLCSNRAAFVTGACVVADGGQTRAF